MGDLSFKKTGWL